MDKFIAGIFAGIFLFIALLHTLPGSITKRANELIEECERSLPRDQHCVIMAVPVSKD